MSAPLRDDALLRDVPELEGNSIGFRVAHNP
jgi:hypothetical protein